MKDALVVGAGWTGLAAAVGLVEAGHRVTLIDAAPQAGGRARSLTLRLGAADVEVDNGQHLMIGAYRSMLALIARVGVRPDDVLDRTPLRLVGPGGFELRAAPLPAPLNLAFGLATARGFPWRERIAMARAMAWLRRAGPDATTPGATVADWLATRAQPAALVERLWGPLCIGALNTPPEHACARAFAQVVHDALLRHASDADFLLPRTTLGDVLPAPAARWLAARGATLKLRTTARAVARDGTRWTVRTDSGPLTADLLALAVPPPGAARLLDGVVPTARLAPLDAFEHEPIATVWLAWRERIALPDATMLSDRPATGEHGQWLFGRSPPRDADAGIGALAGVVVSAAGRRSERPDDLAAAVARQVAVQLSLPVPADARAVIERRATIRCSPRRPRVEVDAFADVAPGLAIAGDWCWHRYPATLESAVRSGDAAARWLATGVATRP